MSLDYQKSPSDQPPSVLHEVDKLRLNAYLQERRDNQNLMFGLLGGAMAAFFGAIAWAIVTYLTNFQIGFMAIGIGFAVGWTVRKFGEGVDKLFGVIGALLAVLGCIAGNLLSSCIFIARYQDMTVGSVLASLTFDSAIEIMVRTFNLIDLLFYALAIQFGYKYSIVQVSEEKMKEFTKVSST
ncbi:MAG: hypothetical protein IPH75_12125 [bacterium]|nr:hypothetical protein [bacterium]